MNVFKENIGYRNLLNKNVLVGCCLSAVLCFIVVQKANANDLYSLNYGIGGYDKLIKISKKTTDVQEKAHEALKIKLTNNTTNKMDRKLIYDREDWTNIADFKWLDDNYKINGDANEKKGIKLISSFNDLPESIKKINLDVVTFISQNSTTEQKRHALFDAESEYYLYFTAEALGSKLGNALIKAYDAGEIQKAAAIFHRADINVGEAKKFFNYPRPFAIKDNNVSRIKDIYVFNDNVLYSSSPDHSFPSGHTYSGNIVSLLMANMLPEKYSNLLVRGASYGYSRVVLGVHYPLDVIGSRMLTQHDAANLLADKKYKKVFDEAKKEFRAALSKECGTNSIGECIAKDNSKYDLYSNKDASKFFDFTLNYNMPKISNDDVKMTAPENAELLLQEALPKLSKEQIKDLLIETARPYGDALSVSKYGNWERINLLAAYNKGKLIK